MVQMFSICLFPPEGSVESVCVVYANSKKTTSILKAAYILKYAVDAYIKIKQRNDNAYHKQKRSPSLTAKPKRGLIKI